MDVPKADGSGTEKITRCYSLSDAPQSDHYRVSIKRIPPPPKSDHPPGRSSNFFHDHIQVGTTLQVRAPSGHFYLEPGSSPVVLIAGGIGITPMLSMLNWCRSHQPEREVWFFYGVRNGKETAFAAHLSAIAAAKPNVHCAEASANLARFDGIRYGTRALEAENPEERVRLSRSQGLGDEVKLRILLGTYVLRSGFQDQYYLRAQRVRTRIRRDFARVFAGVDLVLLPVFPCPAFRREDPGMDAFTQKLSDIFTCSGNLAGLPAMSFPAGVEGGLPVGLQFLAPAFGEELLFQACGALEKHFPSPDSPRKAVATGLQLTGVQDMDLLVREMLKSGSRVTGVRNVLPPGPWPNRVF